MKHVISLGAGVQSSTMALMAAKGEITPMPDFAVFADTQAEPQSVYTWLDWLEKQLPFPVHRVTKGNLADDSVEIKISKTKKKSYMKGIIPFFTKNPNGSSGIVWRKCTADYKILPIQKDIKEFKSEGVCLWLGISTDEAHRQKDSRVDWIKNHYPLIEKGVSRFDCLRWMEKHKYPQPPRSACVFCPYHSDAEWIRLKTLEPKEFQKAVEYEKRLQAGQLNQVVLEGIPFLHSSLKPLDKVQFRHQDQPNMFGNECEGMCGV